MLPFQVDHSLQPHPLHLLLHRVHHLFFAVLRVADTGLASSTLGRRHAARRLGAANLNSRGLEDSKRVGADPHLVDQLLLPDGGLDRPHVHGGELRHVGSCAPQQRVGDAGRLVGRVGSLIDEGDQACVHHDGRGHHGQRPAGRCVHHDGRSHRGQRPAPVRVISLRTARATERDLPALLSPL
ncbi:hypothetical protein T492DRAFT_407391, partial [Pavlovales sp. CCMP2436]